MILSKWYIAALVDPEHNTLLNPDVCIDLHPTATALHPYILVTTLHIHRIRFRWCSVSQQKYLHCFSRSPLPDDSGNRPSSESVSQGKLIAVELTFEPNISFTLNTYS